MKRAFGTLWVASVLLPLAGLVGAGWWCWQGVSNQVVDQMTRTVDMLHEHALRAFEAQEAVLSAIDWNVRLLPWQEISSSAAVKDFLVEIDNITLTVQGIGLVAPDGRLAVASLAPDSHRGIDLSDRDYVIAAHAGHIDNGTFIGAPHRGRGSGVLRVDLSRPRRAKDGIPDGGVVFTGFRTGYFESFYRSIAASPEMGFAMFRADGVVLARYPIPVPDGGARLPLGGQTLQAAQTAVGGGQDDPTIRINAPSLFGGANPAVLRQIANYPLFITHTYDMAVARAEWTRQMISPALAAAIAMALMLMLTARAQYRLALERAELAARETAAETARQQAVDRAELEGRLRQTEKVAALGQLAAGVAHDFNQLLQVITTTAEQLQLNPNTASWSIEAAGILLRSADRGADLTRRMLGFARRKETPDGQFAVGEGLLNVRTLLARALGTRFDLRVAITEKPLPALRGSAAEFEAVIINLVTNARDAMPDGGTILIRATIERFTEMTAPKRLKPGEYVQISTTDTGLGMDEKALARAGAAFFTTKASGTGLGLSMARGFAERWGGLLVIQSSRGLGTKVVLSLPVIPRSAPADELVEPAGRAATQI